jgi:prophage tail gpP-like protein
MRGVVLAVDQPLVQVIIDGLIIPGAVAVEIESVGYFSADRFVVSFAMGASAVTGADYFAALGMQTVTISVALGAGGFVGLVTGQVDNVRIDLLGNTATLSGRDLSALLIDAEIAETYANQTSSQIAATLAAQYGLTPNVQATATPVGQYYQLDHARSGLSGHARGTTAWNLLTWLAQIEGFALSVTGTVLNFGSPAVAAPVFVTPQACLSLTLDMATSLPGSVTVQSWNTRNKTVNAQSAGSGAGPGTTIIRPNLTDAQAASLAANHLANLAMQTTVLEATMPGDVSLAPGAQMLLAGTGSALDQLYAVEAVTRRIEARTGFTQAVRAYAVN